MTSVSEVFLKELADDLTCPVEQEPLLTAVSLTPCTHKVNQKVAEALFGKMTDFGVERLNQPCPLCRKEVMAYYPDHTIRKLAESVEKIKQLSKNNNVPNQPIKIEKDSHIEMPFPGKGARFVHAEGNWEESNTGSEAVFTKKIGFQSLIKDSLFTRVGVLGYKDGSIRLSVNYDKDNYDKIKKFFLQRGLVLTDINFQFDFNYGCFFTYHLNSRNIYT